MPSRKANLSPNTWKVLHAIRTPRDYFGEARTSEPLWPDKILCFTRKNEGETAAEPPSRNHHHRYNLVIPLAGRGSLWVNDQRFSLRYPETLLIFPFQHHHGFHFEQRRVLWLFITFETAHSAILETVRLCPKRALEKDAFAIIHRFAEAWSSKQRQGELVHWLGLLLNHILLGSSPCPTTNGQNPMHLTAHSPLVARINECWASNLEHGLRVKQIAGQLGISESHLRASFRNETGVSLGQHLRRMRLQKAMGLLLQSKLSITQIAERCGFDSIFAFSRSFKLFTGIMASDYRRRFVAYKPEQND